MMLDLSMITPDNLGEFRKVFRACRQENGNVELTLTWKGEVECPLLISSRVELGENFVGNFSFSHGIALRNFGTVERNNFYHRGSIPGTIFHEWCHRMQWWCTDRNIGDWYLGCSHPEQDRLYSKWRDQFKGFYLAEMPQEMAAEAFRVLKGWRSEEPWESNQEFLADWKAFFMNDSIFSLLF